jgi:hypothetical protein
MSNEEDSKKADLAFYKKQADIEFNTTCGMDRYERDKQQTQCLKSIYWQNKALICLLQRQIELMESGQTPYKAKTRFEAMSEMM